MPRRGYTMMTSGIAGVGVINISLSPEGGETKKIISSVHRGGLPKIIVLPLPPVSPGVIIV